MQLLFQMEGQNDYKHEIKDRFVAEYMSEEGQLEYFNQLHQISSERLAEVDRLLEESSDNWKVSRMAKVDLAVLRLSVMEILFIEDVPTSVSINEAVNLAKKYGGETSGKFVNGILGKIVRNHHEE